MPKLKHKKRGVPALHKGVSEKKTVRRTKKHEVFDPMKAGGSDVSNQHSDLVAFRREILTSLKKVAGKGGVKALS